MEGSDIDDIKKKTESLNELAMKLGAKVYEEAAKAKDNNESTTSETKKDDDVEEANYEEILKLILNYLLTFTVLLMLYLR